VHQLSATECLGLLASARFGHVSITRDGLPVILPVAFGLSASTIRLCTHDLALVRAANSGGTVVAFEVDHLEPEAAAGWSVLVRGILRTVRSDNHRDVAPPSLSGHDHDPADDRVLSIEPILVTGRSLGQEVRAQRARGGTIAPPEAQGR